jgi:hypothetical protein
VDTDVHGFISGAIRTPKEHATRLVELIRIVPGSCGLAILQGALRDLHAEMCDELGWDCCDWTAVGRELAKLPGVRRGYIRRNGRRLTVYEIAATDTVIDLAERKRGAGPTRA